MNETTNAGGSGGARKAILAFVLLAVVGVGAYDYFVVRPAFSAASEQLNTLTDLAKNESGDLMMDDQGNTIKVGDVDRDGKITPADVHKILGREPAETVEVDNEKIFERYSWRGISSHNVYVLYSKFGEQTVYYKTENDVPTEDMFRKNITTNSDAPPPSLGGGTPPAGGDDKAADDKGSDDKGADDKAADDKGSDDKGSDDKAADDKGSDKKAADDKAGEDDQS